MKILLGDLRGRNFYMPDGLRPTQNMVRKAVFDVLGHDLSRIDFLELFAGSGAVGLEAVSLNVRSVTWVDSDLRCAQVIEDNLNLLKLKSYENPNPQFNVIAGDAFAVIKQMAKQNKKFDIAFLDPPYGSGLGKKALKTLVPHDILHPDCLIIIQYDKWDTQFDQEEGRFKLIKQKKYGSSFLAFYKGT